MATPSFAGSVSSFLFKEPKEHSRELLQNSLSRRAPGSQLHTAASAEGKETNI